MDLTLVSAAVRRMPPLRIGVQVGVIVGLALAQWAGAAEVAAPARGIGYRGDGSCVARDAKPPITWDDTTGQNILWKTPLPNWSLSSPIAVKDRVFVMSEPDRDHDFPVLVCLNAADGTVRWQREIDHIALMNLPDPQKDEVRKAWHNQLTALRALYSSQYVARTMPDQAAASKIIEANGCELAGNQVRWKSDGTKRGDRVDVRLAGTFNRAGLYFDVWHLGGLGRIGYGYPTPVSDGEHVYIATGLHAFACLDLDGNVKWQKFVPFGGTSNAGYGGDDFCKNARSPLLYGDLLISDVGKMIRAFDKNTGEMKWSDTHNMGHGEIVSPVIMKVGGQDILLTFPMSAYRLPDGKKLSVEGWNNWGGTMLVNADQPDVVFFTGGGEHGGWENKGNPPCTTPPPAAVRFALQDVPAVGNTPASQKLVATVLWSGIKGKSSGECHTGLVYYQGKLYHPMGCVLDAATGEVLAGDLRGPNRVTPATRHLTWIAGDHLYGVREARLGPGTDAPMGAICDVYTLDGKRIAENKLTLAPVEGERKDRIVETVGGAGWGFSYGCPFSVVGDRIYVRGNDYLYCIGTK